MKRIGIVDLGSNSVRMSIMWVEHDHSYHMIEQAKSIVRLSEGMSADANLSLKAMERTKSALAMFKKLAGVHQVDEIRAVATAAVRQAKNRDDFLQLVKEETDWELEVISGEDEAYYDYLGVANTMDLQDFVLMDIGGGSTELAWVEKRKMKKAVSLPLGAVLMTESHFPGSEVTDKGLKSARARVDAALDQVDWLDEVKGLPLVGLGGTWRSIAKLDRSATRNSIQRIHDYCMDRKTTQEWLDVLWGMSQKERAKAKGISATRAEVIIGGIVPIDRVLKRLKPNHVMISGNGVREGLFYETYFKMLGKPLVVADVLNHSLANTVKRYHEEDHHLLHLDHLTRTLFDVLQPEYHFTEEDRKLLYAAIRLHDIGMSIDYFNHQDHSFYLALNTNIYGLSHRELVQVAWIAGSHRVDRKLHQSMRQFAGYINAEEKLRIQQVSALLMIAEQLDRAEDGRITGLQADLTERSLIVSVTSEEPIDLEIDSARRAAYAFRKAYRRTLVIKEK